MAQTDRGRIDYRKLEKIPIQPIVFNTFPVQPIEFIKEKPVVWDDVKLDYYTVNTLGEVFNVKGKKLSTHLLNSGYQSVSLYTGHGKTSTEKYKHVLLHRLVKITFDPIDNPEDYTVDHKDMNKANNRLSNLDYVSQSENNQRKNDNNKCSGTDNYRAKFSYKQLIDIVKGLDQGLQYSKILDIIGIEDSKVNRDYIGNIKRGITYKNEVARIRKTLGLND